MPAKEISHIRISTGTLIKFLVIIFAIFALYIIRDILAALFFAVIVASAIEPAIEWFKERKIPRLAGVILVYLGIFLILFFAVYLIFPLILEEMQSVSFAFPELQQQVISGVKSVGGSSVTSLLTDNLEGLFRIPTDYIDKFGGGIVGFASIVFGGAFTFLLVVVFSFYLAAQEKGIEGFLRLVTPLAQEPYIVDLWNRSQRKLGKWLRAQLLLGALIGVLIFFGLTFLGIKHAIFFAALSAIFEIIPIVGPILAAVPAVITAFLVSPVLGVFTTGLYVAIQQIESHVIVPVVMRKTVGLSPLVVVIALLVGGKLAGVFGVLLAVPITAIIAEFINDWDKKKRALIPE